MTDPVEKYYEDKKRRYLTDLREAAANMKTGTPHDWEDADAYLQEGKVPQVLRNVPD